CLTFSAPVLALAILSSCSSEPAGPAKGTPAFYWQAAGETYKAGDYLKTLDHLDQILAGDSDFAARALTWSLVLSSGMASGYTELADSYEIGGRINKSDPTAFRRSLRDYRGLANRLSLQFAENAAKTDKVQGDTFPLAFGYPVGTASPVPALTKVANGVVLTAPDAESAQKRAIERGVLLAACRVAGAPDDTARTEAILKAPDAKVARPALRLAMAQTLFNESQLYGPRKLDDPEKMMLFCQRAQDMLKNVPDSKSSKDLAAKLQTVLKKSKKG
ncbi:MAG TPA: hypothetical protein VNY05_18245, partial [Candidatus Acidoferrales bacterium]|nr:hypothetical protein [Candidatus Acidoferrales bacterium]